MNAHIPSVLIVGGGVSGLLCGYRLQNAGWSVKILERDSQIGGRVQNISLGQCIVDTGASLIPGRYAEMIALCDELGLSDRLTAAGSIVGFPRKGSVHHLDSSSLIIDGLTSKLFSLPSKLTMLKLIVDALRIFPRLRFDSIAQAAEFDCETASEYAQRKLNPELEAFFVGTTVRGMFGHNPKESSVIDFFWGMRNFLGGKLFGLRGGMSLFPKRLSRDLEIEFHCEVQEITQNRESARVSYIDALGQRQESSADICICATDANTASKIVSGLPPKVHEYLSTLEYTACISVNFALKARPPQQAFVYQIAESEDPDLTTLVFEHNKVDDRAPAPKGLLCALFGHDYSASNLTTPDEPIIQRALSAVEKYVPDARGNIEAIHINRWPQVVVKSAPGTYAGITPITDYRDVAKRVHLVGDYYSLSGMNTAIVSAQQCVDRVLSQYGRPSTKLANSSPIAGAHKKAGSHETAR